MVREIEIRNIEIERNMSSCDGHAILTFALFSILFMTAQSSTCSEDFFELVAVKHIQNCKKLTTLEAEFGWNYYNNSRIDILFGARLQSDMGWLAWGVNPCKKPQMVGTRALIGIKQINGSLIINTYNITTDTKHGCQLLPSKIDVGVSNMAFDYSDKTNYYTIFATLELPSMYDISRLNHVWQIGYNVEGMEPKMHPKTLQNFDSTETIDLKSAGRGKSVGKHRRHLRMVHGILNIIGWGTLLPVGVIIARYFRTFPIRYGRWYVIHVTLQILGYTLGTIGWIIGLWLGHASRYYKFYVHGVLAIIIFTFTTIQMLALRLRPKQTDEYRKYWDIYHHFLGYALLAVITTNIFKGIAILKPDHSWKWAYIGILGLLVSVTLAFEIYTWTKFIQQPKSNQPGTTKREGDKVHTTRAKPLESDQTPASS